MPSYQPVFQKEALLTKDKSILSVTVLVDVYIWFTVPLSQAVNPTGLHFLELILYQNIVPVFCVQEFLG